MRKLLGSFFLRCIRSTKANRQAHSTRRLLNMMKADTSGYIMTLQRRVNLLEQDRVNILERLSKLEQKRGKHG